MNNTINKTLINLIRKILQKQEHILEANKAAGLDRLWEISFLHFIAQ